MRTFRVIVLLVLLLVPNLAGAQEPSSLDTSTLDREIGSILKLDEVRKSKVGIYAIDVETGEVLYDLNSKEAFNPASNIKLLTGAVALDKLGPGYVFATRISAEKVDGATVKGPLYFKSEGDPLMLHEDLVAYAVKLRQKGIEKVDGDIVVDDTAFADGFIPPGYDQKNEDASYRAPIGAVSLNFNSVTAVVDPGSKPGEPANVQLHPPNDHIELVNQVKTTSGRGQRVSGSSETRGDGTRIVVRGSIGKDAATAYVRKRIDNPSLFTGSALKNALETVGIEVSGEVRRGTRPDGTVTLVYETSEPLAYIVLLMNKWSNNFMAEQLYRSLGTSESGPATTDNARAVVQQFMKRAGIDTAGFNSFNGSGLYDGNTITPRQLVQLLDYMVDHPSYPEFAASMAIAGTDGTLHKRLDDTPTDGTLRGKTGTLNEVTALSGYLRTRSGRHVAYSILFNDTPVRAWRLRKVQDSIAQALATFDK